MTDKMGKHDKQMARVGVMWRSIFLPEGLKLPKKLHVQRIPLAKKYFLSGIYVGFSSMLEVSHLRSFGHRVNPSWWRTHSVANHIAPFA